MQADVRNGCGVGEKGVIIVPREKSAYRDNLERITKRFPGKEMLTVKDVSVFCGLNVRTAKKLFEFNNNYISVAKLAREMS